MKNEKNEALVFTIGFISIIFVIVLTIFRSDFFANEKEMKNLETDIESPKTTGLPYKTISATDLNKKIILADKKESISLLDIRPFEEYISEHIMDANNIPLDEFPVSSKIDTHSLIVIIGSSKEDENIAKAAEKLKEEKIEKFVVLAGGMDSWKQLAGATVTYGNPNSFSDQAKVAYTDASSLNDAITKNVPVYILDVRNPEEYAKGHINGAINIPFEELEKRRSEIREKKVVVVGINELQEFQASVQLYDMLLVSPFVMRGAMQTWESNGFPLIK